MTSIARHDPPAAELLIADVAHMRLRPRRNGFNYGVYYIYAPVAALGDIGRGIPFLSVNRFNLLSFYDRDHGQRNGAPLLPWIKGVLSRFGVPEEHAQDIRLLTMPRLFGHVFNPVSFWFCFDAEDNLRAVLSEVNNTFGDSHSYISFRDDHGVIAPDDILTTQKIFHVSPFMDVRGGYTFRFAVKNDKIGVWINHDDGEGLMLTTSLVGRRQPLTARHLIAAFFRFPLVTFKVIGLIHYQAIKLVFKGIKYRPRPEPPQEEITR